ncbi:MAG: sigma-70 family RNA polymerase sigma factor [Verrucomicrobia bacterium]|nr:sigma-70 family RNA polymerase sigma factor [Verrucomicrobiota bacterium]
MDEDAELLRRYTDEKSDEAFAELVRRHLNRVYAVALRQVAGDAHLAHDVTQQVFTALARKASALAERPALSGWLCRSAHFAASDVVRLERRRRAREQEVYAMNSLTSDATPPADWDRIRPALDAAMAELNEGDRDAVALRFFDGLSFAEVGTRLRLSENTARMRVERALDKLHAALARGGITSTTAALATVLGHQASAAPAGMMRAVTLASLKAAAGGEGVLVHLGIFMKKNSVMTAGVAAVAVGVLLVRSVAGGASEGDQAGTARNAAAGEASAPITAVAQRAAAGGAPAGSGSAAAAVPAAKPAPVNGPAAPGPMSRADAAVWEAIKQKRAFANNLRQLWAARDAFLKFKGRLPESLTDLVGPDKLVRG